MHILSIFGRINGYLVFVEPLFHKVLPKYANVADLIDTDLKNWKVDLIKSIFLPFEVSSILDIPINYRFVSNSLF